MMGLLLQKSIFSIALILLTIVGQSQVRQVLDALKPAKQFDGTPILTKKSQVLQLGIGAPNNVSSLLNFGGFFSEIGDTKDKDRLGPFFLDYEYLINEDVGIGLGISYAKGSKVYTSSFFSDTITAKLSGLSVLLSTTYHFYITDKLDPYIKGSVGATLWNGSYKTQDGKDAEGGALPTPIGYKALIGLRYFASEKIAPFGELSYSNIRFNAAIGIAFKLK